MTRYIYAEKTYETVDEVQAAVLKMKTRLDNNPTEWCIVKRALGSTSINVNGSEVLAYNYGGPLTDSQINSLSTSDHVYNVFSINDGDNFTALPEENVAEVIRGMRTSYAKWLNVSKYLDTNVPEGEAFIVHDVTSEDMSIYVTDPN